jgi:hypothetical protein
MAKGATAFNNVIQDLAPDFRELSGDGVADVMSGSPSESGGIMATIEVTP